MSANLHSNEPDRAHDGLSAPSPWIVRFAPLVRAGGQVLDLACGSGRHTRLFLARGHSVLAVDKDVTSLSDLGHEPRLSVLELDLETGQRPAFLDRRFEAVVVVNYLHRPLLADIVAAVASGGFLLYETFARGNERFGRPRNPDFLLRPGELLDAVHGQLRVVAYEDLEVAKPRPAAVQRIAALRD